MIVTKEMEKMYLIKRACYVIDTGPTGDYMMRYASVHWKEGMEVFEHAEECHRAIEKLRQQRMQSGYCPRCNYEHGEETDKDISYLDLKSDRKNTKIYQCKSCRSAWYKISNEPTAHGCSGEFIDYLLEWSDRSLKPTAGMKLVLDQIGDVSTKKSVRMFPANVFCKDGTTHVSALIELHAGPPPVSWFNQKSGWLYLDQVAEVSPSPLAYPYGIAKSIAQKLSAGRSEIMYVRDVDNHEVFSFEVHAGIFMPQELEGRDFEIVHDTGKIKSAPPYFLPADRGGPNHWTMTKTQPMLVWGDL